MWGLVIAVVVLAAERNPAQTGFVPIPKRWIVERAYGILMLTAGWCAIRAPAAQDLEIAPNNINNTPD